jgi:hypothetical protein
MSIERLGIRIPPLAGFPEGYGAELTQLGYAAGLPGHSHSDHAGPSLGMRSGEVK